MAVAKRHLTSAPIGPLAKRCHGPLEGIVSRHGELIASSAAQDASSFSRLFICQRSSRALAIRAARAVNISRISDGLQCDKCESSNQRPPLGDKTVPL